MELKVSSKSNPNLVAGALAGVVRDGEAVELQAIGAGAVNQAVKAIAIARSFLNPEKLDVLCSPSFTEININGDERTALRLSIVVISIE